MDFLCRRSYLNCFPIILRKQNSIYIYILNQNNYFIKNRNDENSFSTSAATFPGRRIQHSKSLYSANNSNRLRYSVKKIDVLRNFAKLTVKHLCLPPATFPKKRLWHRCFPVNFVKFKKNPFFYRSSPDECF